MDSDGVAKFVHQRLLNLRDQTGEQFNRLLLRYGLERLLYRIQISGHGDSFVLKGAMLFALWHNVPGRPTRDIDLLGIGDLTHERLRSIMRNACEANVVDDGLRFAADSIQTDDIRDEQEYHGIRIRLLGFLGPARLPIQIDVGFGDALVPAPETVDYPVLLDFPAPHLRAYHPATVVAEKVNAVIVLGALNSRMKDFYDLYIIHQNLPIDEALLTSAIVSTFARRKVQLPDRLPVAFTPEFLDNGDKEKQWQAFLLRSDLSSGQLKLGQVIADLREWLWPIIMRSQAEQARTK